MKTTIKKLMNCHVTVSPQWHRDSFWARWPRDPRDSLCSQVSTSGSQGGKSHPLRQSHLQFSLLEIHPDLLRGEHGAPAAKELNNAGADPAGRAAVDCALGGNAWLLSSSQGKSNSTAANAGSRMWGLGEVSTKKTILRRKPTFSAPWLLNRDWQTSMTCGTHWCHVLCTGWDRETKKWAWKQQLGQKSQSQFVTALDGGQRPDP